MAKMPTSGEIRRKYAKELGKIDPQAEDRAFEAYMKVGQKLASRSAAAFSQGKMMSQETDLLVNQVVPAHIGKLCMFFYDPLHKKTLPYYDRAPMIIPLQPKEGKNGKKGFLGLNLHYLHPMARAVLLDFLLNNERYGWMHKDREKTMKYEAFKRRRIQMAYEDLAGICATPIYKPTVKHYLNEQVRSRFYLVDPCDYTIFISLPFEQFERNKNFRDQKLEAIYESYSKEKVWADSLAGGPGKRGKRT